MDRNEYNQKIEACIQFFEELARLLQADYEVVASCNKDASRYLVPKGTSGQISYYGKPDRSFRISDHWSWYSNTQKCRDENYVQCESVDMPRVRRREKEGMASKSRFGIQVCLLGTDGRYHHVFGDKFNRKKHTWSWVENDASAIAGMVR